MKRLLCLSALMMAAAVLSAAPADYFSTYGAAYNVDLSDSSKQYTGAGDSSSVDYGDPGYNASTLIAFLGVSGTTGPVSVTISNWYTEPWMYQSASQPNLRRPFGVDFVLRNRWHWEDRNIWGNITDEGNNDLTGQAPSHYGKQDTSSSQNVNFTFSDRTDGSIEKSGRELGYSIWDVTNYYRDYTLVSSWIDIVLVLPPVNENDTSYHAGSADDYYASFDILISGGGVNMTYHCELTGYYASDKPENMDITLSVIPNANASAINLDDATGAIAPGAGSGLHIGDYSYTTTKESSDNSVRYYAFVSSEELPTVQGGPFLLKQKNATGGTYDETNSIQYEIQLASNQVSGRPGSAFSGWFNGTASLIGIDEGNLSGVFFDSVFMEMYREGDVVEETGVPQYTYLHYDNGQILFRLAPGADPDVLEAGVYESYIYFHVVAQQ